ncbi:uncharacterized protein [Symphalangus syndactylus]|uniref:uncharacterized protein n=1 Tax=Symphalangus syndactylus TaxID=9590 RepID=UPI0030070880
MGLPSALHNFIIATDTQPLHTEVPTSQSAGSPLFCALSVDVFAWILPFPARTPGRRAGSGPSPKAPRLFQRTGAGRPAAHRRASLLLPRGSCKLLHCGAARQRASKPGQGPGTGAGAGAMAKGGCPGRLSCPPYSRPAVRPPGHQKPLVTPCLLPGPPAGCKEGAPAARLQWRLQKAWSEWARDRAALLPPPPPPSPPLQGAELAAYCQRGR